MPADLDKEELVGGADAAVTFDVPDAPQPEHGRENESENGVRRPSNPPPSRSSPAYRPALRQQERKVSAPRTVKETLHAKSEYSNSSDDGRTVHKINQYTIKEELGRGSFGAVHLAVDQYGTEYAVKEFSKSRLRKRAQSNILRRPHGHEGRHRQFSPGALSSSLHPHSDSQSKEAQNTSPISVIREEIAIMKKLNHHNLVSLYEVLDDPNEDSLYMVMEMCKKGVIMKVGMNETADPYDVESCRCWFRDMILGIEYLHAQGVAHRDIKPDNLLLTEDDELKIVDFGVSEIFEKASDMLSAKSAGSPAFLPPELCVSSHGTVSGKAADIWSMGVTLYCLCFGRVPFEKTNILELYESIKVESLEIPDDTDPELRDLIIRILDKDPESRIKMSAIRIHPWVTKSGKDPLMSEEENVAKLVEPPTDEELNRAITSNMSNLLAVVKAVKYFKRLLNKRRPHHTDAILGQSARFVQPPLPLLRPRAAPLNVQTKSDDTHGRQPLEATEVTEGAHRDTDENAREKAPTERDDGAEVVQSPDAVTSGERHHFAALRHANTYDAAFHERFTTAAAADPSQHRALHHSRAGTAHEGRGQAHDPLEDHLYLGLNDASPPAVAESPGAIEMEGEDGIFQAAYRQEVERVREEQGTGATVFLTRRVDKLRTQLRELRDGREPAADGHGAIGGVLDAARKVGGGAGLAGVLRRAREKDAGAGKGEGETTVATKSQEAGCEAPETQSAPKGEGAKQSQGPGAGGGLAGLVAKARQVTADGAQEAGSRFSGAKEALKGETAGKGASKPALTSTSTAD